jgi:very-short-patch-repair endonuclease
MVPGIPLSPSGKGYRVLRFWNNQVTENLDGVLQTVAAQLGRSFLTSSSPGSTAAPST